MKVRYEKKKPAEKKQLIAVISEITGEASRYMGPPDMCYAIGDLVVDRDGNLIIPDEADAKALMDELKKRGYVGEAETTVQVTNGQPVLPLPSASEPPAGLSISLPKSKLPDEALERMEKLLEAKGTLILKALGASNLKIEREEDKFTFPWFDRIPEADQVESYTKFVAALAKMARKQSRISAKEKASDNEKYAFRCFLLRLGFIGDEFKKDRSILLKNFDGSSAFRTRESEERFKEKQAAKKAE